MKRTLQSRLTGWHVGLLAAVLIGYALVASYLLLRDLRAQLVRFAIQDLETVEGLLFFDDAGRLHFNDDYHNHPESRLIQDRLLEVRDLDGAVLYRNERLGDRLLDGPPLPGEGEGGYSERQVSLSDGTRAQLVSRKHAIDGRPTLIRVAYSLEPLHAQFRSELVALLGPLPAILALAGLLGYYLVRRALDPLHEMSRKADQITGEHLHARLPVEGPDAEIEDLARIFNRMLGRIEQSFDQLKRFTSDASHELRTPLTVMRSVGEVGLQTNTRVDDYRDTIGSMLEEARRLTQLVENLLTISRADGGQLEPHVTTFRAIDLAYECRGLLEVLLEDKSQTLVIAGDETIQIHGDWLLLRQALVNVIHNAIKYSPVSGIIRVQVERAESGIEIAIQDSGPGIPAEHRTRVFERFYRIDGRGHAQRGAGLGLSIAQWTVRAHGGEIGVSAREGSGATVTIRLPLDRRAAPEPVAQRGSRV